MSIFQAKVRARLSRPLQKGKGRHVARGDFRSSRGSGRVVKGSWSHPSPRSLPMRGVRGAGSRIPPPSVKRPAGFRDRRPVMSVPVRARPLAPPARSYDRRAPGMIFIPVCILLLVACVALCLHWFHVFYSFIIPKE